VTPRPIAIIGAGSIGLAWSIVFARAKFPVQLCDPSAEQRDHAKAAINERLQRLSHYGLLAETPDGLLARITICDSEEKAVANARHVQENAPEDLSLKKELMARLDALADPQAAIASSTSTIPASQWAADLPGKHRCLNIHPGNPPYLLPVVELIPAPFTEHRITDAVRDLMIAVGQKPVLVAKEVEGFVFNRLQGAVLREAYCLVRDGVATVEDIDTIMREGLGLRWSFMGPFETVDLNTNGGIAAHAARLGPAYRRMGNERGQDDPWTPDLVAKVVTQRRARMPLEKWAERGLWRDEMLMKLRAMRARDPAV
jgi:3-hydroxyacyl-CoA dehydrogenase